MITHRTYANACHWGFGSRMKDLGFSPLGARTGDRVFLKADEIHLFVELKMSSILSRDSKFVFVTHDSDVPFDEQSYSMLEPHAIHIYAINTTLRRPKLTTIPLGISENIPELADRRPRSPDERDIEVYMNFSLDTNVEKRTECYEALKDDPRVYLNQLVRTTTSEYVDHLCRSKFVVCPVGNGVDTHRVYEALACGATPVVLHTTLDHLYEQLPICIVNNWSDPYTQPTNKAVRLMVSDYLI